jgi:DNA-binding transcriptional LysR family regulator
MLNAAQLSGVDLNLLVLFDVVLAEKNVSRAARRLNVSASAVSHGLGRLRRLLADPLFLRTPKGVLPTARASEIAPAIADILSRVGAVVAASTPFDARTSTRRFVLGMADATAVVVLPALLAHTQKRAPLIDIGLRHIFPFDALAELEAGKIDVALAAVDEIPARFSAVQAYEEEFVIAARRGHPFLNAPSLKHYCASQHILVSASGDQHGFVDELLARKGLSRRVALTVPSFMLALASLEQTELLTALPLSLARTQAARFSAAWVQAPLAIRNYSLHTITSGAALQDAGVAWLFDALATVTGSVPGPASPSHLQTTPKSGGAAARKRKPRRRPAKGGGGK